MTKGYIFTAGRRHPRSAGQRDIPEGMHLRMNAPKKNDGSNQSSRSSMIEITGLLKKAIHPGGVGIGGGVADSQVGVGADVHPVASQALIEVEGWRQAIVTAARIARSQFTNRSHFTWATIFVTRPRSCRSIQVVLLVHDPVTGFDELAGPYTHSITDRTHTLPFRSSFRTGHPARSPSMARRASQNRARTRGFSFASF